jgi:hypothetical protein
MPDTSKPFSLVRGRAMRATKVNACGAVVLGPTSKVESKGFISVDLTANTEAGTAISVTNANNDVCILDEPPANFTGYGVVVNFCGVDPDLFTLMTGQEMVMDGAGTTGVGLRVNSKVDLTGVGFALEVWSVVPAGACDPDTGQAYGYVLLPFIKGGYLGDFSIANDAVNFTLAGAVTKDGNAWGVGPYNVTKNVSNVASPLNTAMDDTDHLHLELVTVPPPTPVNGATAVGVPATSAVAGTPGTYLPANSYGPANLAAATGLTASPNTNWTSGQHVILRDGSLMNWNGSAWVAGAHA